MSENELILDQWAKLDFKHRAPPTDSAALPDWVGDQKRRQSAYVLLASYLSNVSRHFVNFDHTEEGREDRKQRREFGDPSVVVETIVAALLGKDVTVTCKSNQQLEDWANKWAKKTHAIRKLFIAETHAVGLGDGVFVLSWDSVKKRPELKVYDPSMYYPVLDAGSDDDFPERVHIMWEFDRTEENGDTLSYVRRKTWELKTVDGKTSCYFSDGEWRDDHLNAKEYDDFPTDKAKWYVNADGEPLNELDMGIDFIPVIHLPNSLVPDDEHFGESSLATVLQILDDIQAADSDLSKGAAIAGFPPLAAENGLATTDGQPVKTYGPGTVFGGTITALDTSTALDALLKYVDYLLSRLSVNTHLPESVIGRVDPTNIVGISYSLSMGPLEQMVYRMRLVRDEIHPMVFEFAWKIAEVGQMPGLPARPTDDEDWPTFKPGRFLPADMPGIVAWVVQLRNTTPPLISLETALRILIAAGVDIDDIPKELTEIAHGDFDGAVKLAAALGDEGPVFEYLGRTPPERPPLPDPPKIDPNPNPNPNPNIPPVPPVPPEPAPNS